VSFLAEPPPAPEVERLYDADRSGMGYVMNLTRLWGHQPEAKADLQRMLDRAVLESGLTFRQRGILVTACASTLGDSYCSLAWGGKLSGEADPSVAVASLTGGAPSDDPADRALAEWARRVVRDPNATTAADVQSLRDAGFDDHQVFAITLFVGLRLAFSTINAALGATPDPEVLDAAPAEVREAVTWGRPVAAT
jgi:alkylhydroperoxidase family enzyme